MSETITYGFGTALDQEQICQLHIESWRTFYRGMLTDRYLDEAIFSERKEVWEKRFEQPDSNRVIITAKKAGNLIGFSCFFLDHDPKWGCMLDNLHVSNNFQGIGLGANLLNKSIALLQIIRPEQTLYLWVLEKNLKAIGFYEKMKGEKVETSQWDSPDGQKVYCHRYVWSTALF